MLSKQLTKIIQNLEKKKFREKYNLFKIEGSKLVKELLLSDLKTETLLASSEWIEQNKTLLHNQHLIEVNEREMKSISNFQSLPEVIALATISTPALNMAMVKNSLSIGLNGIQDPGNLGTILRIADWFGIQNIFCDHTCVDVYNPKCIQASMGAIFRVQTHYLALPDIISVLKKEQLPIFGTFLRGDNIYTSPLSDKGMIIMGNEGKGISATIEALIDCKLTIPSFAHTAQSSESLNVGVATGIVLSEFKRRIH